MYKSAIVIATGAALMMQVGYGRAAGTAGDVRPQSVPVGAVGGEIFHIAIFRFAKEHVSDAAVALRELSKASRRESGNLAYDVYRSKDDSQAFYIVEHWTSSTALAAHEHSEAFIRFGREVLAKYSTLHDTVTAQAFDVAKPATEPP
jgi:quinol monooxygenase YgiN